MLLCALKLTPTARAATPFKTPNNLPPQLMPRCFKTPYNLPLQLVQRCFKTPYNLSPQLMPRCFKTPSIVPPQLVQRRAEVDHSFGVDGHERLDLPRGETGEVCLTYSEHLAGGRSAGRKQRKETREATWVCNWECRSFTLLWCGAVRCGPVERSAGASGDGTRNGTCLPEDR